MKEEILSIASDLREGFMTTNEAKEQLLVLFGVSNSEAKLICGHSGGVDSCSYKHKDVFTCKHIRKCQVCGN